MAISVVQTKHFQDSFTGSFTSPTTAGNTVVVGVISFSPGQTGTEVTGITLGGSADNFQAAISTVMATDDAFATFWVDTNCGGFSSPSIAVSATGINTPQLFVTAYEIAGLTPVQTAVIDQISGAHGTNTNSWQVSTPNATTNANEIVIGLAGAYNTTQPSITPSPLGTWTELTLQQHGDGASQSGYSIISSTGIQTYTGTVTSGSDYIAMVLTLVASVVGTSHAVAGAGITTAGGVIVGGASSAGAGIIAPLVTQKAPAALPGAGTLTALATTYSSSLMAGAGILTTAVEGPQAIASLTGAGTATAKGTMPGVASGMAGVSTVTANASVNGVFTIPANLAGAGTVSALGTNNYITVIQGAGTVTPPLIIQLAPAQVNGQTSLTATGTIKGTAPLPGVGATEAAGESTTIISIPRKITWQTRVTLTRNRSFAWFLRYSPPVSATMLFKLAGGISRVFITRWNIRTKRLLNRQFAWNTGILQVNTNAVMHWKLKQQVTRQPQMHWKLVGEYRAFRVVKWNTRVVASPASRSFAWKNRQRVTKTPQFTWNTRQRVTPYRLIHWHTYDHVFIDPTIDWNTLHRLSEFINCHWSYSNPVQTQAPMYWRDRVLLQANAKFAWDMGGQKYDSQLFIWNTDKMITLSATVEWNVGPAVLDPIRQTALNDIFFAYPGT